MYTRERRSVNQNINFPSHPTSSMPTLPVKGALIKVCYTGACMGEGKIHRRGTRPSLPGHEIAGVLESTNLCPNSNYNIGDRVILHPDAKLSDTGMSDYIAIDDADNLIQVPFNISLEVASMLPGAALLAYCAVRKAKRIIEEEMRVKSCVDILIVGAGGQGLWTLQVASWLMKTFDSNRLHITIADGNIERLMCAREYGCSEIIHWNEEDHEQYIIERTRDACRGGGMDIVIDYVGSQRTVARSLSVLNENGVVLVGGGDLSEVSVDLKTLADKQQSIMGIPKGSHEELRDLVSAVSTDALKPPCYSVYNLDEAAQVFEDLGQSRIVGRAILRYHPDNSTVNYSNLTDNFRRTTMDLTDN